MAKKKLDIRVNSIENFFKDILDLRFFTMKDAIRCSYEPGESKLVVVTGENATGKSFLRRVIHSALQQNEIELIALSMELRTRVGDIRKAFIYGDEGNSSTGQISGRTVTTGIRTSRGREAKHAVMWDEPDTGLSDNYAAGAADAILKLVADPKHLFFAGVTTHRRVMLERFAKAKPHHLRLGDDKRTLAEVLAAPVEPMPLDELDDRSLALFRKLHKEFDL